MKNLNLQQTLDLRSAASQNSSVSSSSWHYFCLPPTQKKTHTHLNSYDCFRLLLSYPTVAVSATKTMFDRSYPSKLAVMRERESEFSELCSALFFPHGTLELSHRSRRVLGRAERVAGGGWWVVGAC